MSSHAAVYPSPQQSQRPSPPTQMTCPPTLEFSMAFPGHPRRGQGYFQKNMGRRRGGWCGQMFWVGFAGSDLRTGARTESRSCFPGKPIRCTAKPRAREVRKSRWTQTACTPPYDQNPEELLFRRYIPGPPISWHPAQRCSFDTGLWGGAKHLQQHRQRRFSGMASQNGPLYA